MPEVIPIITYEALKERLESIQKNQHRTFLKTTYFSLGRVGEIVNTRSKEYSNPAVAKANFEYTEKFLMLSLLTEKRQTPRKVPIARIDLPTELYFKKSESWITEDIISYIGSFKAEERIWDRTTRWGEKVFKKHFPEYNNHIHYLRHWRASHLLAGYATGVKIPDNIVAKMGGWKGTNTLAATYDGTTIENYIGSVE